MMDLFVSIAKGFKPLTNVTKVLSWMSNKVVNVPLVFLALPKINSRNLRTIILEKVILKSSNFAFLQILLSKKYLEHLTL